MNAMTGVEAAGAVSASAFGLSVFRRSVRSWPEDRVGRMCLLLAEGKSFSQVSDELGMTRTAVAGQVDRLRLRNDPRLPVIAKPGSPAKPVVETVAVEQPRQRDMPEGFADRAAKYRNATLAEYYGVGLRRISRWRKESGVAALGGEFRPLERPANFAELAPAMALYEAELFFRHTPAVLKRWAAEAGINFRRAVAARTPGCSSSKVRETQRDMSRVGQAAEYLRKFGFVYRCDAVGRPDPSGKLWRRGNAVLTNDEIIERAEWNGWDADAWRKVAA